MKFHRLIVASTFMGLAVPAAYAAPDAVSDQTQQPFEQMQATMDKAQQAETPADRQKLMTEHMNSMQKQMTAMRGMMTQGGMMPKDGMKPGGMMSGPKDGMKPGGMMPGGMTSKNQGGVAPEASATPQLAAMQKRMDAMQQMMEQMLQEQKLMIAPAKP